MGAINSSRIALFLCLLSSSAVGQSLLDKKLSIVVYDAAHIGPKTLERAERLAGTILLEAGIPSSWNAGAIEELENLGTDFTAYPGTKCQAEPIAPILRLRILSHAVDGVAAQALGFSLPCARQGVQVTIYADRVANVSETGGPTFGRVLAYAMAHELGHLLLHSGEHEAEGLMKGVWSKSDWQRAAVRIISFSPADKQRISGFHEQFADRNAAQLASLQAP